MATPRPLNKKRQFLAILHKNFILQTRGRRSLLGIGGWAGLILQLLLPVSFFLVMYLPKHYIKPVHHRESLGPPPVRLESSSWAEPYDGPATFPSRYGRASLLLTPDTPAVRGLARVLARTLACPREPRLRICPSANLPASFHCMFIPPSRRVHGRLQRGPSNNSFESVAVSTGTGEGPRQGKEEEDAEKRSGTSGGGQTGSEEVRVSEVGWTTGRFDWMTEEGGGDRREGSVDGGGGLLQRWWSRRRLRHLGDVHTDERRDDGGGGRASSSGGAEAKSRAGDMEAAVAAAAADAILLTDACADFSTCTSDPACYEHVLQDQITFMDSQEAARLATVSNSEKWDAVVHFPRAAAAAAASASTAASDNPNEEEDEQSESPIGQMAGPMLQKQNQHISYGDKGVGVGSAANPDMVHRGAGSSAQHSVSELLSSVVVAMNHTDVPPTGFRLDLFDVVPTRGNGLGLFRRYWFFANLQLAISRAVIGIQVAAFSPLPPPSPSPPSPSPSPPMSPPMPSMPSDTSPSPPSPTKLLMSAISPEADTAEKAGEKATAGITSTKLQRRQRDMYGTSADRQSLTRQRQQGKANEHDFGTHTLRSMYDVAVPVNVEVSYKPFPWPAVTEDLGAAGAAVFFQLLLVYAFLPPTRAVVGDIVREKELRLREGMRVLGLSESSYWLSWGLTHWLLLAFSGALCTAAGTYPFANSSAAIMLVFFWLYAAALVSYGYCLSTLFSSSRVAGTVVQLLYALSMLPGFVLPAVYQYGSWTWYVACLAPPSAATLFAAALINWEKVAEGIRLSTLWTPITQANGFCAATVLWMLALDVVLYGILTWYLDKVLPKSYGQRLPWWFIFDQRYWAAERRGAGGSSSSSGYGISAFEGSLRQRFRRLLEISKKRSSSQRGDGGGVGVDNSILTSPLLGTHSSVAEYGSGGDAVQSVSVPGASRGTAAVEVRGLVKLFRTLTGETKVAVNHLDLQIESGRITALLGHNGAGKTTTIHILTGMLQPTAGTATVNGYDVATQMDRVRASLGICPQFDILWPDLTVYEHLELYGAIKGYSREELHEAAVSAASNVGLLSKLRCPAGELSGGQRRKLSVAIAFLGNPAVVFLDEPTSGMDPYSRRFTWEVIRRHRLEAAIVLTTHSMEEADLLGDQVVILAGGRVAAEGTGMELKASYGVGYNLTLVIDPHREQQQQQDVQEPQLRLSARERKSFVGDGLDGVDTHQPLLGTAEAASNHGGGWGGGGGGGGGGWGGGGGGAPNEETPSLAALPAEMAVMTVVRQHVPTAELISAAGVEVVIRLPREAAAAFPALLRELDGSVGRQQLGVASYGLSLTTLEEVFLSITAAAEEQAENDGSLPTAAATTRGTTINGSLAGAGGGGDGHGHGGTSPAASCITAGTRPPLTHPPPLHGWRLYGQQLRALLAKRALCARRDRLAVITQLAVPLALVYLALWISSLQVREPSESPLELSRGAALFGRPLAWSASPAARNASEGCSGAGAGASTGTCLAALLAGHPSEGRAIDSGATALYTGDPQVKPTTLETYLLRRWYGGTGPVYDALHVVSLPPPSSLASTNWSPQGSAALSFVLLTNQSAISALPAALSDAMSAAWSYINGGLPSTRASAAVVQDRAAASTAAKRTDDDAAGISSAAGDVGPVVSDRGPTRPGLFSMVSWPLPVLASEPVARIQRDAASLMLVLCLVLASSVLSASFVVFLVREQDNNSKHLQLVSGAPATAYWAANYGWDLISYSISAAGLLGLIVLYRLPQYSGQRLAAVAGLLWGFGPAGISLTYLLHFVFRDEMRALQRLNTAYFLTGYLGFVATWICDLIELLVPRPGSLHTWNRNAKWALRTASPHYCFARGMYDVQSTYDAGFPFGPRRKPFDWDVFGSPMVHMALQTLVYGTLVILYDAGVFKTAYVYGKDAVCAALQGIWGKRTALHKPVRRNELEEGRGQGRLRVMRRGWWEGGWWNTAVLQAGGENGGENADDDGARVVALEEGRQRTRTATTSATDGEPDAHHLGREEGIRHLQHGRSAAHGTSAAGGVEDADMDEDVAAEKSAVMAGRRNDCQVLLDGVRKVYSQGLFHPPLEAVRGLWIGIPAGECFGLLGVNGAGKTTTFRMLTGEVLPDAGDARVGGFSVRTQLGAARQQLGYCPQFEALPGAMTGQEVVAMYARLRGVPEPYVGELASYLLRRLGLEGAARNPCGGYSGGMKRKLGVAVALVGDPRVCALDEPSTGMDPGARRGLWTCLQNEVIRAGRTVVLTSHSMEECEALCTRLTILVGGRQRCLGTVQHLKSRFGGGYVLEIKTLPHSSSAASLQGAGGTASDNVQPLLRSVVRPMELSTTVVSERISGVNVPVTGGVRPEVSSYLHSAAAVASGDVGAETTDATQSAGLAAWVASVCPGAVLSYVDQNRYTFCVPRDGGPSSDGSTLDLAALFEAVESNRTALGVVDYCLTQTTLEQLFVSLAGAAATGGEEEGH